MKKKPFSIKKRNKGEMGNDNHSQTETRNRLGKQK